MQVRYVIVLVGLIAQAVVMSAQAQSARLISVIDRSLTNNVAGAGASIAPVISANGKYVAFASTAANLATNAQGAAYPQTYPVVLNVFLRDRTSGLTRLISVNQAGTAGGNGNSQPTAISPDGRYVLFESEASNLVPGDSNDTWDVFVRDTVRNVTVLVSANANGVPGDQASQSPAMTPDGRYVAFVSSATDLTTDVANGMQNIFVRNLQTGTTVLATPGAAPSGNTTDILGSDAPDISSDGRYVAFYSTAVNLIDGPAGTGDIYVRDLAQGTTLWASAGGRTNAATAAVPDASCYSHSLSANGQFVAYEISGVVLRCKIADGTTDLINTNGAVPDQLVGYPRYLDIASDGSVVAYVAENSGPPSSTSITAWNATTQTAASISPTNVTQCANPLLDSAGRIVAYFAGSATAYDLYTTDLQLGTTQQINKTLNGDTLTLGFEAISSLSIDGRFVAFDCGDDNLVVNDSNHDFDVFVGTLSTGNLELISSHSAVLPSQSPDGLSSITSRSVSQNGRRIAFVSSADNVIAIDQNNNQDIFVRDLDLGSSILVSAAPDGTSALGKSWDPAISADGRYVAFASYATNLVANDNNNAADVFIRDLNAGTTTLVSVNMAYDSSHPQISSDGRYVLFATTSSAGSTSQDLYLRDVQGQHTWLIVQHYSDARMTPDGRYVGYLMSRTYGQFSVWDRTTGKVIYTGGTTAATYSALALSPDGKQVVSSDKGNLLLSDLAAKTSKIVDSTIATGGFADIHFSADGQQFTFVKSQNNPGDGGDICLYDLMNQTEDLVSHAAGSSDPGNDVSDCPQISADGRFVAYRTRATNIAAGHTNDLPVIALYNTHTHSNALVSASRFADVNDTSFTPVFSGDSRSLVFQSWNSGLSPQAFGYLGEVFLFPMFYAAASTQAGVNGVLISWPFVAGEHYRVEYTESLSSPNWQPLTANATQQNDTMSILDSASSAGKRFYRVVQY